MSLHITDEELLDVLNGHAAQHVTSRLMQCEDCWQEAQQLNASLARYASTMKFESARAEAETLRRPIRLYTAVPAVRWAMAAAAGLVLAAMMLLSSSKPATSISAERHGSPVMSQASITRAAAGLQTQSPAARVETAEQERADDALLMQVQDDMDRELPAALQPVVLIVAERNQFAERTMQHPQGENE